jgi:pimeloyl-ACP methyl ester carboxylesterase
MDVEANGLRFHVVNEGEGRPVVLLHGFPDTSRLWRAQVDALVAAGYRAIAPDLRGRGASERPPETEAYRLMTIVGDVTGIMDALGVEQAHVVGHDFGAGAAWLLASFLPERVDHLVAISLGFPGGELPDLEALQKGWYRLLLLFDGVAEEVLPRDDWRALRVLLQDDGDVDHYIDELSDPSKLAAALNWYRANLRPERVFGPVRELPPVQAPTLGIFGTGDAYLTERDMLASEQHVTGGWRYERLEGVGHWVPLEAAAELNRLLLEFLPR